MRYLSFFSGVEMAHLAVERHGWELVACAEIDPFASAVIAERLPHVPNLGVLPGLALEFRQTSCSSS